MKTKLVLVLFALTAAVFILPGCYTQLSSRDRDYRWRGYDQAYDDSREQTVSDDAAAGQDTTYADEDNVTTNYYTECFVSPTWHFRYYHPSYGFSLAYGYAYDPFWGDPWWGCTPWYSPYVVYSPFWYSGWWGYHGYWGHHYNGGDWAYQHPIGRGGLRNTGGLGRSLQGRDLVRLSTPSRSREVVAGVTRRSTLRDAVVGRPGRTLVTSRDRNTLMNSPRSSAVERGRTSVPDNRRNMDAQRSSRLSQNESARPNTNRDARGPVVRRGGFGEKGGQAVDGNSNGRNNPARGSRVQQNRGGQSNRSTAAPRSNGGGNYRSPSGGGGRSSAPAPSHNSGGGQRGGNESGRKQR